MKPITYIVGDATRPQGVRPVIIAHCCNDAGAWGAGFVLALSRRWPKAERDYRALGLWRPGSVQFVEVEHGIIVANIIGQHGVGWVGDTPPIRYEWLHAGFIPICNLAKIIGASVHMPRIGCGLAGGEWAIVESLINEDLSENDVPVFVYDLQPAKEVAA